MKKSNRLERKWMISYLVKKKKKEKGKSSIERIAFLAAEFNAFTCILDIKAEKKYDEKKEIKQ